MQAVRHSGTKRNECLKRKAEDDMQKVKRLKSVQSEMKELQCKKAQITQLAKEEALAVDAQLKKLKDSLQC